MSLNETGIGGIKEAILEVAGDGAYSRLKFEGGVHRVQRVPSTESSGRIHTSTATVIVLPEADERRGRRSTRSGTSGSTSSAAPGRAASRSTRPTPRSGSPTSPRGWWSRSRTRRASTRTRPRRWPCCAPACTTWSSRSSASAERRARRTMVGRRATGRRRSGPTTFPTTGSPTTGSGPRSTTCRASSRASSTRSSTRSSWRTRPTACATSRRPTMAQDPCERRPPGQSACQPRPGLAGADDALHRAGRPPDRQGHRPRLRPGPQAGQPVPADRPVRRRPPRHAAASACTTATPAGSRARSCGSTAAARCSSRRSAGGNYRGAIQLTNPRDRAQHRGQGPPRGRARLAEAGDRAQPAAHGRRCSRSGSGSSTTRRRRARSSSSSSSPPTPPTSSRSAAGRGPRAAASCPIAHPPRPGHVPLRRPRRRADSARTSRSASRARDVEAVDPDVAGLRERRLDPPDLALDARRGRGARAALADLDRPSERPTRHGRRPATPPSPTTRCSRPCRVSTRTRSRPRTTRGTAAFTEIRTDNELFNLAIDRSAGDLRLLVNDGPGRASATWRPASRGSRRCSGGTRSSRRSRRSCVRPQVAVETLEVLAAAPGDRGRPGAGRGARQDPARAADRRDGPHRRDCRTARTTAPWTRRRCG